MISNAVSKELLQPVVDELIITLKDNYQKLLRDAMVNVFSGLFLDNIKQEQILRAINEVEIKLDSTMKSLLDNWREMTDEKLKNIIVEKEETLTIDYTQETALANLVTNVGKRITGADISLFNLGGFRTEWYP